jgi:hypothetical protein
MVGAKLDQNRLALLKGAFSQVKTARLTNAKESFLAHALNTFHTIANLPEQGETGTWRNAELRCVAFLGMAVAHQELNDSPQLIAENLILAIQADCATAERWLGSSVVQAILRKYPSLLPPFPPYWGHLTFNSNTERFQSLWQLNGALSYNKQSCIYTLKRGKRGICYAFMDRPESEWKNDLTDYAFHAEIIFRSLRPMCGGMLFRAQVDALGEDSLSSALLLRLRGYYFSVCTDGSYSLNFIRRLWIIQTNFHEKEKGVEVIPLAQGEVPVSVGTPLQIGAIVRGSDLGIYANAQPLAQVKDNLCPQGNVAIAAGDWEHAPPFEVQFRNFQLWTRL